MNSISEKELKVLIGLADSMYYDNIDSIEELKDILSAEFDISVPYNVLKEYYTVRTRTSEEDDARIIYRNCT